MAVTFNTQVAYAADEVSQIPLSPEGKRFKRGVATVIFASIGGGILGLSTLSFYGKPQEHTSNISTGVLLGFLGGISYVAYSNMKEQKMEQPVPNPYDDSEAWREWLEPAQNISRLSKQQGGRNSVNHPQVQFFWSF